MLHTYHIAGYFRRDFIFGYFEERPFSFENKFLGPTVLRKYIHTIKLNACLHSYDYITFAVWMHFVALWIFQAVAALKQQKEWPSKSLPFGIFWPRGTTIFANICSGEQGNYCYKINDSHMLSLLIHYRTDHKVPFPTWIRTRVS